MDDEKAARDGPVPADSHNIHIDMDVGVEVATGEAINASGHKQELERQFSLFSISSVAITAGNQWVALGGSIAVALYNGGPPGVIYEFLVVSVCYWGIAACIADMASSIPSSAGVYHWASVTGGRYGRVLGFFAGWWNFFAYLFGTASTSLILANQLLSMYALFHPSYIYERWHVFVTYLITSWLCCAAVLFANRALPALTNLGFFFILAGCVVTVLVCAIMPSKRAEGYATNAFVWREWQNQTGWENNGFVFCAGMLNGAYAVGTPDCVSHLAEEIPEPHVNIPKAILAQYTIGLLTTLPYLIALFYGVSDLPTLTSTRFPFPLAELYRQATSYPAGSLGLLVVIFAPTLAACLGCYLTAGRMLWTLGRDGATPFSAWIGRVDAKWRNPWNATLVVGALCTALGAIYVGSTTAFNAFVGSFVVLSTLSYLAFLVPNLVTRRRHVRPGPFHMSDGVYDVVGGLSCAYMGVFIVVYCFPYAVPFDAVSMNYASLMSGGLSLFVAGWWVWMWVSGGVYEGPGERVVIMGCEEVE